MSIRSFARVFITCFRAKNVRSVVLISILMMILVSPIVISSIEARGYMPKIPNELLDFEKHSARNYMVKEREFVKNYLFDPEYGGVYFSVDRKGNVLNSTKYLIAQANVILFLAGLNSQDPDPSVNRYIDSSAGFIVDHLKWGHMGPGTWWAFSNRTGGAKGWMVWLAPSEAYVSYALLWAYRITKNSKYLEVARANLDYQISQFPDGRVLRDADSDGVLDEDVGYRSPERMAHYAMWRVTGEQRYLEFARKFHRAYVGRNSWEEEIRNATRIKTYLHGSAIIDLIQYALASGDEAAIDEGRQLVEAYWRQGGDDHFKLIYDLIVPGHPGKLPSNNGADNGKDHYQKRLAMDLALWTITGDLKYRMDAITTFNNLMKFWDPEPPHGFWFSLAKEKKTCFTIGHPSLIDITPPLIRARIINRTIIHAEIIDPEYEWLDFKLRGIGVDPTSVSLFYSLEGRDWAKLQMRRSGDVYMASLPESLEGRIVSCFISASDYFNNTACIELMPPAEALPPGIGASLIAIGAGLGTVAMAIGLGLALSRDGERSMSLCRYWGLPCTRRHNPLHYIPNPPEPIDEHRYYCHYCIWFNYAYWFDNYQLYGKDVDLGRIG